MDLEGWNVSFELLKYISRVHVFRRFDCADRLRYATLGSVGIIVTTPPVSGIDRHGRGTSSESQSSTQSKVQVLTVFRAIERRHYLPRIKYLSYYSTNSIPILHLFTKLPSDSNCNYRNSRLSPISQISKTPSSAIPLLFNAFFKSTGGSKTSSSVSTHVPQ